MEEKIKEMVFERVIRITGNKLLERLEWNSESEEFTKYFKSLPDGALEDFITNILYSSLDSVIDDCLDSHLIELNYHFDRDGYEDALDNYLGER